MAKIAEKSPISIIFHPPKKMRFMDFPRYNPSFLMDFSIFSYPPLGSLGTFKTHSIGPSNAPPALVSPVLESPPFVVFTILGLYLEGGMNISYRDKIWNIRAFYINIHWYTFDISTYEKHWKPIVLNLIHDTNIDGNRHNYIIYLYDAAILGWWLMFPSFNSLLLVMSSTFDRMIPRK